MNQYFRVVSTSSEKTCTDLLKPFESTHNTNVHRCANSSGIEINITRNNVSSKKIFNIIIKEDHGSLPNATV